MSTNDHSTFSPLERSQFASLVNACESGVEEEVRKILSGGNVNTDCLKTSVGYKLLYATLSSFSNKLKDKNCRTRNSSGIFMICEMLLQHGTKVDEFFSTTSTPLHLAVQIGNQKIIKLLLARGAVVKRFKSEDSPLNIAVDKESIGLVKLLLEHGANPGNCDDRHLSNTTPLHIAVFKQNIEIVNMLLKKLVVNPKSHHSSSILPCDVASGFRNFSQLFLENPNHPDNLFIVKRQIGESPKRTFTPLHAAISVENKEILKILLSKGMDVNAQNNHGETPLHRAIKKGFKDIAQLLLENGADVNIRNKCGEKHFDCHKSLWMQNLYSLYMIKMYLDAGKDVNEKDDEGYTPLHHAINFKSKDTVFFLLGKGCNIHAVTKLRELPLHLAVKQGEKEIVYVLLRRGCDVNAVTTTGSTPLNLAANSKDSYSLDLLKTLIQHRANTKFRNEFGLTALHYAVRSQCSKKVEILLGKNPDTSDKDLKLAFCLSFFDHDTYHNCKTVGREYCLCKLFVALGFTIRPEDFNGMHIPKELYSDWLRRSDDPSFRSMVEAILNKQATSQAELIELFIEFQVLLGALKHEFTEIFSNLFTPSVNVSTLLLNGNTLLHYASQQKFFAIVEELIRRGADVNALNDKRESPLHFALRTDNNFKIIKILVENGADVNAPNARNESPLLSIFDGNPEFKTVRLLLEYGADVNYVRDCEFPLCKALYPGDPTILKLLFHYGAFVNRSDSFDVNPIFDVWESEDDYQNVGKYLGLIDLLFNYGAEVQNLHMGMLFDYNQIASFKVKSIAAGLEDFDFPGDSYFRRDTTKIDNFKTKCVKEITRMKSIKINGYNISMHDLLIKSPRESAVYMKNENAIKMLNSLNFEKKFPLYVRKLNVCVLRAKLENRLLELSNLCLEVILKVKLPDIIVCEILSYLNTSDLHRLIIASPIDSETKSSVKFPFVN